MVDERSPLAFLGTDRTERLCLDLVVFFAVARVDEIGFNRLFLSR